MVAVAIQYKTGGWFFVLSGMVLAAPILAIVHVGVHAWSCRAINMAGARAGRALSNLLYVIGSLALVDADDHCSYYSVVALLAPRNACMGPHTTELLGRHHNFVLLALLLGSWLLLLALPKRSNEA